MESTAYIKYIHISPKKLRFIISDVKKKTPKQALDHLFTSQTRSAKVLYKALKSAISNATQALKVDDSGLQFKTFLVEEGPSLKRMRPGSKGMANMYKRRTSHIKVVLIASSDKKITKQPKEIKKVAPEPKKIEKTITLPKELKVAKVKKATKKTETK